MTTIHTVRLTRDQNEQALSAANDLGITKDRHLADVLTTIASTAAPSEPDWVTTRVAVTDDTWAKVSAVAKARGITVSALLAEHAA